MAKWHFIFRDRLLGKYEKLVAAAYASHQNGESATSVNKQTIAADCGISVRQVERCKVTLKARGILAMTVVRTRQGRELSVYRIVQPQGELEVTVGREKSGDAASTQPRFECNGQHDSGPCNPPDQASRIEARGNGTTRRQLKLQPLVRETIASGESRTEEIPVDNTVDRYGHGPPGATGSRDAPDFATASRILSGRSSENSNSKPARKCVRAPQNSADDGEQRRRIEAKNLRLQKEADVLAEARIGAGPKGESMRPDYLEFIGLQDGGRIPKHVTWALWKTLTAVQRIDLLDKPGPQAVQQDLAMTKTASS